MCICSFSFVHMCVLVLAARKIIQCMSVLGAHACRNVFLLACMPAASETLMIFMLLSSSRTSTVSCGHVSAYGRLGGCVHALLSMWVHAYFFSVIYNEHWTMISFSDIFVPDCHCLCDYTFTFPPPNTLPYYPRTQYPPCIIAVPVSVKV